MALLDDIKLNLRSNVADMFEKRKVATVSYTGSKYGKAEIEAAKCQGCGNCAAACPAKAIQLSTFTDTQERALFHSILCT